MYDIRARNSFQDRAAAGPRTFDVPYRRRSKGADLALPEAELLRAIGRALEEQRAKAARPAPLVDRIATILGNPPSGCQRCRPSSSAGGAGWS